MTGPIQPPRGFKDILPPRSKILSYIEETSKKVFKIFNYSEIRIPTVEYHDLFIKSTGQTTDIVEKEMYVFEDASKRLLALRPEGTPGVIRAYINQSLHLKGEKTKFFYIANMFRAERPQAARYREFEQIGVENIGDSTPYADAELIIMLDRILKELGISEYRIDINSIGCPRCRPSYREKLINYLSSKDLCDDCKRRLERNPLRVLDCKIDRSKFIDIPKIELCDDCKKHYDILKKILKESGISFYENILLVRGLDYYTRTVFEFVTDLLGSQDAIGAGGRYDELVKSMGGPDISGSGWAFGAERVLLLLEKKEFYIKQPPKVFIVSQPGYEKESFKLLNDLRNNRIPSDYAGFGKSIKAQMRSADANNVDFVIIIGEDEIKNSYITLKDLKKSIQKKVEFKKIIHELKQLLEVEND